MHRYPHYSVVMSILAAAPTWGSIELNIDARYGSTDATGVSASLTLEFTEHGDDDILTIVIQNTTSPKIGSQLTAVGLELPDFVVEPPSLVSAITPAYFDSLTYDDSKSPEFLNAPDGYDLVLTGDGNFHGGDPNGAPAAGARESVMLSLGNTGMSDTELEAEFTRFFLDFEYPFVVGRFQVIGAGGEGSDKVGGDIVPEPASLLLLVVGAAVLIQRRFRRT